MAEPAVGWSAISSAITAVISHAAKKPTAIVTPVNLSFFRKSEPMK
jgi:hypothetical protein